MSSRAGQTACVTNVQRYSLHDGGGIRTTVFLKGCPFTCPWCCNPENLSAAPEVSFKERLCMGCSRREPGGLCAMAPEDCPTGAKTLLGEELSVDDVMDRVLRDAAFYEESGGGLTVSGGEALLWQPFVRALLGRAKAEGLGTAVETTLALPMADPAGLAAVCDRWLVDFKVADRDRSVGVCRIDPEVRDRNLAHLRGLGADVVARMPIVPGHTDSPENVAANLDAVGAAGLTRVDVLPFHQLGSAKYDSLGLDYAMGNVSQLSEADVAWVVDEARARGLDARVRGE
ncbi:pyruvate formate-lyase 2-activating enzyme [Granulimonas faecalis]|uniref:Pyruvate formate-lyase 2-activating enzyme n=1 Tax=Granulimonas faecalis TaxID=2894155 RepID=A0AAV5B161_9ACTN|nr:radical SAM protein [Granulimonas faecalis]GJM54449.1 pyruvate formate-lyase 2-activating enzyme [Granulimonas faecalis]